MSKAEREIVKQAIRDLMDENGNYAGAILALCELVGWDYPAGRAMQSASVVVPLHDLACPPESKGKP